MRWFFKKSTPVLPPSIYELGPQEVHILHDTGKIKNYETGEFLFREGDKDSTIYLVLKGAFRVTGESKDAPRQFVTFTKGDWIGEGVFLKTPKKVASVIAKETSTVLALDDTALRMLDRPLETYIRKKVSDLAHSENHKLSRDQETLSTRNEYLAKYIVTYMDQQSRPYDKSEMILNMFKNLPSLPLYTNRIIQLITDDESSAREVTESAKEDPSLVSQILKTINSAYYSLSQKISDIQYAITYLGFNQVYQIVVSNGLRKTMPNTPEFRQLHDHSVIISHLVFLIGQHYDRRKASTASTIALLHDIGKSVTLLLKKQNPKMAFFVDMLDTCKIGAILLRAWNLPENICQSIEYQRFPEFAPPSSLPTEYKENIALLYIAHAAYEYLDGNTENSLKNPFLAEYMRLVRFSGVSIEELVQRCILSNTDAKVNTLPKHVRSFIMARQKNPLQNIA
ncbi:HDOD domain-containing protein [Desulforhabdus amnigena]|jgi:HD-like signal output (HDOD) protein|uniref:HDOD domain-containing protein n=1 Tax=Desulforhabdus amnigena TaxID=40218 RepID=A0A9W6FVK1_9BACT|nr:HDOD domain-containing protein [Desulforhabdus amnigena]NLJ28002.1 HDOD domain-containing protein [Deltaproteobacteria bacterium]GLI35696.1 hypothetical protein DAMNIGENAA_31290 [Desulforhabdus amnigena]